jgi:hypothetical protein
MEKRIVFAALDGTVSVIVPSYQDQIDGKRDEETEEAYLARVVARNVEVGAIPVDAVPVIVAQSELPSRVYRNAWALSNGAVVHDMAVARNMKLGEIRAERNRRLAEKDIEFTRAQGAGNSALAAQVEADREHLRSLTASVAATLSAIPDVAGLQAFSPAWPVARV